MKVLKVKHSVLVCLCLILGACGSPVISGGHLSFNEPVVVNRQGCVWCGLARQRYSDLCGGLIVTDDDVLALARANGGVIDQRSCR